MKIKLLDAILFALVGAFLIIGIYHTVRYGIIYSYSHFMVVVGGILWLNIRQTGKPKTEPPAPKPTKNQKKSKN